MFVSVYLVLSFLLTGLYCVFFFLIVFFVLIVLRFFFIICVKGADVTSVY